ncbi:MAG: hypothetical protein ABFD51_12085, partial [Anaerolineaceae bacterium]
KMKKSKPLIWIIDDDSEWREIYAKEIVREKLKNKYRIIMYPDLESAESIDRIPKNKPDFIVFDIGVISGVHVNDTLRSLYINSLVKKYINCVLLICSAVRCWAEDAVEEIKEKFREKNVIVFVVDRDLLEWVKIFDEFLK